MKTNHRALFSQLTEEEAKALWEIVQVWHELEMSNDDPAPEHRDVPLDKFDPRIHGTDAERLKLMDDFVARTHKAIEELYTEPKDKK